MLFRSVTEFKDKFIKYFDINNSDIVKHIKSGGEITMDMGIRIEEAVNDYAAYFLKDGLSKNSEYKVKIERAASDPDTEDSNK